MPLYPGAWQSSPGPQTSTVSYTRSTTMRSAYSGTDPDFPTVCEPPAVPVGSVGDPDIVFLGHFSVPDAYRIDQALGAWELTDAIDQLLASSGWSPPLPWPSGATDWEWDLTASVGLPHPQGAYLDSLVITSDLTDIAFGTGADPMDVTVIAVPMPPTVLTWLPFGNPGYPFASQQPLPGADMSPIIGSAFMPAASNTASLVATLTDFTYLKGFADGDLIRLIVNFATDAQRTHTAPPLFADRQIHSDPSLNLHFTPPQWRFLYSVLPPLRQYPRDDFLGGAPRQGKANGSTSTQSSARQGWQNTYR